MAKNEPLFSPAHLNVVAKFRTLKQARKAMEALEAHGFDAGAIRLEGAGVQPEAKPDTRKRDSRVTRFVGSRTIVGLVIGGAVGFGIGMIVGALAGGSALAMAVGRSAGVVAGAAIGGMVAGVGSLDVTPDWERTFEDERAGPVTVAAGSDDPEKVGQATEAIRGLDPIDLNRVDEHGNPV